MTNKTDFSSFGSPISIRYQYNQEINHPHNFSKGVASKQLMIKSPTAYVKNIENFPLSTDSSYSARKRPLLDFNQMKSDVMNIKTELSFLKTDISANTKNLKEIDINMMSSPTQRVKIENQLRSMSSINEPFNKFYKNLDLASRKNEIKNFCSISPTQRNISGVGPSIENKIGFCESNQQSFPNSIQIIPVDYINNENSSTNYSFTKINTTRTHSMLNINSIRPTVNNYIS